MHTRIITAALISAFLLTACSTATAPTGDWALVWSDEFDGTTIDTTKWDYETGYVRNSEYQYYTKDAKNAYLDGDGHLVISALRETRDGYAYTSASLNTKGKQSWKYGKFEMRAKIPTAAGCWPAWWALGTNIETKGWPACGEIDMMEFYRGIMHANVMDSAQKWFVDEDDFTDDGDYHTWVMIWESSTDLSLYRDGDLKLKYTGGDPTFDKPFYLLVNLAIGGTNGGDPSGTAFPQNMYIDYIRVYQRSN
jgi:beta-glucanase (GH16 family)